MSGKRDSNPRPSPWQGDAPPIELFPQFVKLLRNFNRYLAFFQLLCAEGQSRPAVAGFQTSVTTILSFHFTTCAEGQSRTDIPGFSDQCRDHLGYFGMKCFYYIKALNKINEQNQS